MEVAEVSIAALVGLFCFAAFFEGYHRNHLNWLFRAGYLASGVLFIWPLMWCHGAGLALFITLALLQGKPAQN
jgi:TRAP-type uncharacterized transport system fused permease subunit